jgi:hypothetical protein
MSPERMTDLLRAELMTVPVEIHESRKRFAQVNLRPMRLEQATGSSKTDSPLARVDSLPTLSMLPPAQKFLKRWPLHQTLQSERQFYPVRDLNGKMGAFPSAKETKPQQRP